MLLKLTGGALVIIAASALGFQHSMGYKMQVEELWYLYRIVQMCEKEIRYTRAPLTEVYLVMKERLKSPYQNWMGQMASRMEERTGSSAEEVWKETVQEVLTQYFRERNLSKEEQERFLELGAVFEIRDVEMQHHGCELYMERLRTAIRQQEEALASKQKLSRTIGVAGGVFLAVLLL